MSAEALAITDPNVRIQNKRIEKELKEHEAANMARAEEKERQLLERKGLTDVFLNGIEKISKLFSQKKKKEIAMMQKKQKANEK